MPADISFNPEGVLSDAERAALQRRQYVEALHREREGYLRYGRAGRAADVEAELAGLGEPVETAVESAPRERAVPTRKTRSEGA